MREPALKTKIELKTALCALIALTLCACTTVLMEPQPRPDPVGQVPDQPAPSPTNPDQGPDSQDRSDDIDEPDIIDVPDDAAPYFNNREGITLPHMVDRGTKRVALLLPFSAQSPRLREEAASMFKAAELALFQRPNPDIIMTILDTKGTENGTRSATRTALQQGADIILGPVIARNVMAASQIATPSGTPLLAFSNDQSVADRGRYLLSFPPEAEVDRIVGYAASEGVLRFAFFGPDDDYGRRVLRAYEAAVARVGGELTAVESYQGGDITVMQAPAQKIADFHRLGRFSATRDAFEAILLPEGGISLRSLAPLLPFYGVDPARVMFMGTSRWDDREAAHEPALRGGVFAATDKEARSAFLADYERAYGDAPSSLASLAYDAVQLGAVAADGDPLSRVRRIENSLGFYGTDGYLRFGSNGRPDRGLAVYRVDNGQFQIIDPAPRGLTPES